MNEITRIHLAQTPLNIEVVAKKELEKYLAAIKATLHADDDTLREIEARIAELLAERGVVGEKVITSPDVAAIKEQLGAPGEFVDEQETEEQVVIANAGKRLMRDQERGVLGGVLAGIGAYTGIDPIWVRLIAIVLAFLSFGTVLLIYIVLWIAVPAAKTAADKLQMSGRHVTLASIKEQSEAGVESNEGMKPLVVVLRVLMGIGFVCVAIGALVMTGFAVTAVGMYMTTDAQTLVNAWLIAAFVLAVISGLLFMTLNSLLAYAAFAWRFTKRMVIATVVIVAAGLIAFGIAAGLGMFGGRTLETSIDELTHTEKVQLDQLAGVQNIISHNKGVPIQYKVTGGQPYAEFKIVSKDNKMPKWNAARSGDTLELTVKDIQDESCQNGMWHNLCIDTVSVTIYGPALSKIESREGRFDYTATNQENLEVTTQPDTTIALGGGTISKVHANVAKDSIFDGEGAAILNGDIKVGDNASVSLGVLVNLALVMPEGCPANSKAEVSIQRVTNLTKANTSVSQSDEIDENCTTIRIQEPISLNE
jgi:phage shock protein PspC (stress-responsive transcriptional regulator)